MNSHDSFPGRNATIANCLNSLCGFISITYDMSMPLSTNTCLSKLLPGSSDKAPIFIPAQQQQIQQLVASQVSLANEQHGSTSVTASPADSASTITTTATTVTTTRASTPRNIVEYSNVHAPQLSSDTVGYHHCEVGYHRVELSLLTPLPPHHASCPPPLMGISLQLQLGHFGINTHTHMMHITNPLPHC